MAVRNKSIFVPNETYFITFTVSGWKHIFTKDKYCQLVFRWFNYMKEKYGNKIFGYVTMPNHIHVLLRITDKSPVISKTIQNAKRFMAYDIVPYLKEDKKVDLLDYFQGKRYGHSNANYKIFKERYDSLIIQSEKFFLEKLNYIHRNPCQEHWQLADSPEDYQYSSASNYTYGRGVYEVDLAF